MGGGKGHCDGEGVKVQCYPLKEGGQSVLFLQHDLDTLAHLYTPYFMAVYSKPIDQVVFCFVHTIKFYM